MFRKYYREIENITEVYARLKESIRMAFSEAKDDLVRFVTYTSVLLLVFLFLPRLKLLTLVVASLTGFVLDFVISGRLTIKRGEDLISRTLTKYLKV